MCSVRRIALGRSGEDEAAKALKKSGYRIIERNYRCRYGEVDIVAVHDGVVVFVEVKTRGSDRFGTPKEGVDYRKQVRITRSSSMYLAEKGLAESEVRFDVVSIEAVDGRFKVEIVRDAFEAAE